MAGPCGIHADRDWKKIISYTSQAERHKHGPHHPDSRGKVRSMVLANRAAQTCLKPPEPWSLQQVSLKNSDEQQPYRNIIAVPDDFSPCCNRRLFPGEALHIRILFSAHACMLTCTEAECVCTVHSGFARRLQIPVHTHARSTDIYQSVCGLHRAIPSAQASVLFVLSNLLKAFQYPALQTSFPNPAKPEESQGLHHLRVHGSASLES
eukprot:scaffold50633_cov21-Tisochrysis_lutea.AAC.3